LRLTNGNREHAATLLGVGGRTFYRKLKEYRPASGRVRGSPRPHVPPTENAEPRYSGFGVA
jgi:hypothetical protein